MLTGYRPPRVWFTSDWHLGHKRIIELCRRPFDSVEQMNAEIIENHNALVEETDVVWMLGDMIMGDIEAGLNLVSKINGRKHLICGNHDRPFHGHGQDAKTRAAWRQRYLDAGFASVVTGEAIARTQRRFGRLDRVGQPVQLRLGMGIPVILSHFPYGGDTRGGPGGDRFAAYRPVRPAGDDPPWLLCGHVHDAWDFSIPDRTINVGVDVWSFTPVPASALLSVMEGQR